MLASLPVAPAAADDVGTVVVSLHYVAPGKHVDFLKCAATQDALAKEAGVPATH